MGRRQVGSGFVYSIKAAATAAAVGIIIIITHTEKTDSSGMIRQMMQLLRTNLEVKERRKQERNAGAKKVAKLTREGEHGEGGGG